MGYFSNLAIDYVPYDCDHSCTPPELQLLWRLEDLQDRLEVLVAKSRITESSITFSEDNLRYVLPQHFMTVADVKAAIELTVCELREQYGIHVREEKAEDPIVDEITGMQISFSDFLSAYPHSLYAA